MKNLYIDFDGVILDTIDVTYNLMKELKIDKTNLEEVHNFYASLDWKELLSTTPEINDSIFCIQKIVDSKTFDVAILTQVNSLNEMIEKVHFIKKNLENITIIFVPRTISKTKMVNANDAILIDDYTGNLKEWEKADGIGILFSKDLKDKGFKVINRLDQILEVL
ncbi:MAG: hypothetical protein RRY16_03290 [Bacilli bacterium]